MNVRSMLRVAFAFGSSAGYAGVALAQPPAEVQEEVGYLISDIGSSGCEFYRNGSWLDAAKAADHMRYKYDYLVKKDRIGTTEDFIDRAASKSSFSGQPYKVRCAGGEELTSQTWLLGELARHRAIPPNTGPGLPGAGTGP